MSISKEELVKLLNEKQKYKQKVEAELYGVLAQVSLLKEIVANIEKKEETK